MFKNILKQILPPPVNSFNREIERVLSSVEDLKKENKELRKELTTIRKQLTALQKEQVDTRKQLINRINNEKQLIQYEYYRRLAPEKYEEELKLWYKDKTGKTLDLDNPKSFREKIQWLKLYDSTPLKTRLADKYLVREWIKEKIGEEYLIPLLGVWDNFDDINFDKMPKQFVLKANHGSGWNIIVKNKSEFNKEAARRDFKNWMSKNKAFYSLELHYMNIPPKIIAEPFLENDERLYDYKVFCFDGKAEVIMFLTDRYKFNFYNLQWEKLPIWYPPYVNDDIVISPPENLDLMIELAEKLSAGFCHVRVDFHILNDGSLKFSEMTFTTDTGLYDFKPDEYNLYFGDLINLPPKKDMPKCTV